jgi:alkaline phosphatase D
VSDPIVISGDMHAGFVGDLAAGERPAAPELVGTSISSPSRDHERIRRARPLNEHVRFADARLRGYVRCDVTPGVLLARLRAVSDPGVPGGRTLTQGTFSVRAGTAHAEQIE